jgi:hypothetical protein
LQLVAAPMRGAAGWIAEYAEFWSQQLDALGRFFEEESRNKPEGKKKRTSKEE